MRHPALERMRPAQRRALHLLDAHFGPLDPTGWPTYAGTERVSKELALRSKARELLDDEMRLWLEQLETNQKDEALAELTDAAPDLADLLGDAGDLPEPPDSASVLHQVLALAHHVETAIYVAEPSGS